jgi:hypothetical protein
VKKELMTDFWDPLELKNLAELKQLVKKIDTQ